MADLYTLFGSRSEYLGAPRLEALKQRLRIEATYIHDKEQADKMKAEQDKARQEAERQAELARMQAGNR